MLSYSICMRVCAHAHVDMWTCGHVYTCVHVEVHLRCCSWRSIHLFTRTWNSPVRLGWPVRQPQHWDYRGVPHLAFLCGFWDWTQVFTLAQQELYHLSCLPIPSINHWRYGPWHLVRHILLDAEGNGLSISETWWMFPWSLQLHVQCDSGISSDLTQFKGRISF